MAFHPNKGKRDLTQLSSEGPTSLVAVSTQKAWALLRPQLLLPRQDRIKVLPPEHEVKAFLSGLCSSSPIALDFETKGNDPCVPGTEVVGLALAGNQGVIYLPASRYEEAMEALARSQAPLVAHNVFFDASWPARDFPELQLNWRHCTYALLKLLATEGWPGQEWGLKAAQKDLLLWKETNETALDNWLVGQGHTTAISTTANPGLVPFTNDKGEQRWGRPNKGLMHLAPHDILGQYCALDAESTWLLYTHILLPILQRFAFLSHYAGEMYMRYILLLVQQKLRGIQLDMEGLRAHHTFLEQEILRTGDAFLGHPDVGQAIEEWNKDCIKEVVDKEPVRLKKDGGVSKNWLKWRERVEEARRTNHFNLNSGPQKQWLFYSKLGYRPVVFTDKGNPAVDDDALKGFGEPGALLSKQNELVKEQGYVTQILELQQQGVIHPGWRVPGTLTGRLAGKDPNLQQLPKSRGFLQCFRARPGFRLVQMDFSALEQVVLAELSKDPSLWKLYGPGAPANDVYLFTGAYLPQIGERIREAGYDPDHPTKEAIAAAKKECKKERGIAKVVQLASSYGAGPGKIAQTLRLSGIQIGDTEAMRIHAAYWELYGGVKRYERLLRQEYKDRGGWLFNGLGRPLGVDASLEKDLVNRVVQSTGHDCLVILLDIVVRLFHDEGVEAYPWIADFHDELFFEVREDQAELAARLVDGDGLRELNRLLSGQIALKGEATVVNTLADSKCEG